MPTEDRTTQFIAQLKIEKKTTPTNVNAARPASEQKREVSEVSQITLRASTLPKLVERLGRHIEIIEED